MTTAAQPFDLLRLFGGGDRVAEAPAGPPESPPVRYAVGPVVIEVRSDLPDAASDLRHLYAEYVDKPGRGRPVIRVEARATARLFGIPRRFTIFGDGEELFPNLRPEEVLPYIEWAINYRVIARCRQFLQFHAATLARDGQGIMLVGQSGCGKSTLTAILAAQGWQYLSDEFALLDPITLELHPFPKALCVKSGSFHVIRELGLPLWSRRPYVKAFKGRVAFVTPSSLPAASVPVPLRAVVFPRFSTDAEPGIFPVARSDAAFRLAANAFNRANFGEDLVATLADVVSSAACATFVPGTSTETATLLASIVQPHRSVRVTH